jgi:HEAT repeat protein
MASRPRLVSTSSGTSRLAYRVNVRELPPKDRPDEISIGPIGPIPIIDDDDPRFEEERAAQSAANRKAQSLHSADELLQGLQDPDWRVRHESVPRLVARWKDDPRTLEAVLHVAADDESWQVRSAAVMTLTEFKPKVVESTLRLGLEDENEDVRWSARFVLFQLGLTDEPPPGLT